MPNKEETFLIGIDDATRCPVIGSISMALVAVDTNFFRRFSWLPIRDSKTLTPIQINKVVDCTRKHLKDFACLYIKPEQIEIDNLKDLECQAMIELLNKVYRFWKHRIFIDNFDSSKDKFIERFQRLLPQNVKKQELDMDKWTIIHSKHKVCALASIYAKYYSMIEHNDIKAVWGDFGSGNLEDPKTLQFIKEHVDCPHIRKSGVTLELPKVNGVKNNGENKE
jgi:ribonuclease HII